MQNGVAVHVGVTFITGASDTERYIVGASRFTGVDATVAGVDASGAWSRAYNYKDSDGDRQFTLLGDKGHSESVTTPVIDPLYKRTVDSLSMNGGASLNVPLPRFINGGISHGIADTNELGTIPVGRAVRSLVVTPLQKAWNYFWGN